MTWYLVWASIDNIRDTKASACVCSLVFAFASVHNTVITINLPHNLNGDKMSKKLLYNVNREACWFAMTLFGANSIDFARAITL